MKIEENRDLVEKKWQDTDYLIRVIIVVCVCDFGNIDKLRNTEKTMPSSSFYFTKHVFSQHIVVIRIFLTQKLEFFLMVFMMRKPFEKYKFQSFCSILKIFFVENKTSWLKNSS